MFVCPADPKSTEKNKTDTSIQICFESVKHYSSLSFDIFSETLVTVGESQCIHVALNDDITLSLIFPLLMVLSFSVSRLSLPFLYKKRFLAAEVLSMNWQELLQEQRLR